MEEKKKDDWRTGRPITKSRSKRLDMRISEDEINLLNECTELTGLNRSDTIITALELLKKTLST